MDCPDGGHLDDVNYWPLVEGTLPKPNNDKEGQSAEKDRKALTQIEQPQFDGLNHSASKA